MAEQAQGGEQQAGQRPVGDVFSQFGEELTDSLRQEFAQLRAEAADRAPARGAAGCSPPPGSAAPSEPAPRSRCRSSPCAGSSRRARPLWSSPPARGA
jgi:hypothetical protein